MASILSITKGEDYKAVANQLEEMFAKNVMGRHKMVATEEKNMEKLTAFTRVLLAMTTFSGGSIKYPCSYYFCHSKLL